MRRLALSVALLLVAAACDGPTERPTETIEAFLADNGAFGAMVSVEPLPDWAEGSRHRVFTERGSFLLYMKRGEVYAAFSAEERFGRLMLTCVHYRADAEELSAGIPEAIERCRDRLG